MDIEKDRYLVAMKAMMMDEKMVAWMAKRKVLKVVVWKVILLDAL